MQHTIDPNLTRTHAHTQSTQHNLQRPDAIDVEHHQQHQIRVPTLDGFSEGTQQCILSCVFVCVMDWEACEQSSNLCVCVCTQQCILSCVFVFVCVMNWEACEKKSSYLMCLCARVCVCVCARMQQCILSCAFFYVMNGEACEQQKQFILYQVCVCVRAVCIHMRQRERESIVCVRVCVSIWDTE